MTNMKQKTVLIATSICALTVFNSCKQKETATQPQEEAVVKQAPAVVYDTNNPKTIVNAVAKATGGLDNLKALKDVVFDYHYVQPDGKKDISQERYIFNNEISWAKYTQHDINVAPQLKGNVIQFFDGKKAFVYNEGKAIADPNIVGVGQFLRQANYMWFTMMFKLGDPGTIHKYQGQEVVDGKTYDKIFVTYDAAVTGKKENDVYILYVNPKTHLVDQFKFSVPAFKIVEPILLAKLTYQNIKGIQVITRRQMFSPNPKGEGYVPMVDQKTINVKFNNGFTASQLAAITK